LFEDLLQSQAALTASEVTRFELLAGLRSGEQIAGTASALGTQLLTVNVRHFPIFEQLDAPYQYE
jgi:predicted nucleic acid-binding protein